MKVAELKAISRERGLRGYSWLRRAELVALLQNNPPPPPPPLSSVRFRQPSPQEMDIFEQQEMSKSRPQVTSKLNDWYDWLVNHVPKIIKDGTSRAFKTFKDKIRELYNRVTGNQTKREELNEPEWNFKEREQAFGGAYRSYRVEGVPKMDPETFFRRIREGLIEAIKRDLGSRNSARVQTTTWIRFVKDNERIELAFNSRMMNLL